MRKLSICILLIILSGVLPVLASFNTNIPQATLQIAKNTGINYLSPLSKIVRVAIGSQNFSSYVWDKISIYGTGEFEIYDNNSYISTYDHNNIINIGTLDGAFVISDSENKQIAKVSGPIVFKSDYGFLGIKGLKRAGVDALYRGKLELVLVNNGKKFHVINSLGVEEYLKGVVPNEMPVRFGLEALKSQSVAARNYVLSPRVKASPYYDVVDSVASQVYYGVNTEKELSNRAVLETTGIVALYNWDLILALYSSTAGGYTESYSNAFSDPITKNFPANGKPYLKAKPDYDNSQTLNNEDLAYQFYSQKPKSFDSQSPYFRWEREWNIDDFQKEIQDHISAQSLTGFIHPKVEKNQTISKILRLNVLERGLSGKIMKIQIETEKENYIVEKELVIRRLFTCQGKALPSANIVFIQEFDENGNLLKIKGYGGGYGHGVGLSQFGAGFMSTELNYPYEKILQHYYSGISLGTVPFILSATPSQNKIEQTFFTKDGNATLIIDNKYKVNFINLIINGVDETIELKVKDRYNRIDLSGYLQKGLNTIIFSYPEYMDKSHGIRGYVEIIKANE